MKKFSQSKNKKDKVFSQYPCSVYLHNALRFLSEKNFDVAYEEICYALLKSGDELSAEEETQLKNLQSMRR